MDWNQSTMYEQRVRFILEVQQRTFSFAESCRRYGISRTAGYTWWTRFLAEVSTAIESCTGLAIENCTLGGGDEPLVRRFLLCSCSLSLRG